MHQRATLPRNRLANQASPYLRQHAGNPVDWYPWGSEALELARRERRPILLSVGYAACHWCHVMAHESFEDAATAALMNELYVNIKVDREQRPDLDRLYQLSQQMLSGRGGGWPLTMFLMHEDQRPFFGGTYFPPEARFGLPAFRDLLRQVASYYHSHLDELRGGAARVVAALDEINSSLAGSATLTVAPLQLCRERLQQSFDSQYGGFGSAPKFPHVPGLERLLRDWHAAANGGGVNSSPPLQMVELSLRCMAEGGLFDQLGGGFFRYSVDQRWEIPHFEKMLYDNALLLGIYAEAAAATRQTLFAETAVHTADWMLRELKAPEGALYSSLDADSEGHEGRFYVWQRQEVQQSLSQRSWPVLAARFGLTAAPNFEGQWHLRVSTGLERIAADESLSLEQVRTLLAEGRASLLQRRSTRVRPGLDDKVLCSWNALAISSLSLAARCLGRDDYAVAATAALRYLRRVHWRDGRLLAASANGRAEFSAYLDDYAFLLDAVLELQCVRFRVDELSWAIELAEVLLRHFEDTRGGGFFFTADDHEALISRSKSFADEAIPAGNAVAARALLRLGYLLGEVRYLGAAERTLRAAWPALQQYPESHASLLQALEDYLDPPPIVILRGRSAAIEPWHTELNAVFAPRRWVLAVPTELTGLPEALASKPAAANALAYVCRGSVCAAPLDTLAALMRSLNGEAGRA
jgi:uncharacterized protein